MWVSLLYDSDWNYDLKVHLANHGSSCALKGQKTGILHLEPHAQDFLHHSCFPKIRFQVISDFLVAHTLSDNYPSELMSGFRSKLWLNQIFVNVVLRDDLDLEAFQSVFRAVHFDPYGGRQLPLDRKSVV